MDRPQAGRRPRRILLWSGLGLGLVAVVAGVGLAVRSADGNGPANKSSKKKAAEVAAAPVALSRVERGSISTYLETTSVLEPRNSAALVARKQGQVVALAVEEGAWVKQGQVLARLDDTEARLAVERARPIAEMAVRELERGRQLHGRGLMSHKDLDDLELKLRSAKNQLEQARWDLAQMRIVAPFSGMVIERLVNLGETVTAGRECFRLADFDPLLARVYFPERELSRVRPGQQATVHLDAFPGTAFTAVVSLVNPAVDRSNGTFKVTLEVRDPEGVLRPGNFARVKLRTGSFDQAVLLPRRAILNEDGEDYVFVARGDSVSRVAIRLGAVAGDTAQIVAGLAAGESVVTVGQGGLKAGARIKPVAF